MVYIGLSWLGLEPRTHGCLKHFVLIRIRTEDMVWVEGLWLHWDWNQGHAKAGWPFMVSTRIGAADGSRLGNFGLNQDWNRGQSILGNFLSWQDWNGGPTTTGKLFVSTRIGTEVRRNYKGNYFIRVFNLCKGGILPYKGVGIQYSEKWRREIIRWGGRRREGVKWQERRRPREEGGWVDWWVWHGPIRILGLANQNTPLEFRTWPITGSYSDAGFQTNQNTGFRWNISSPAK